MSETIDKQRALSRQPDSGVLIDDLGESEYISNTSNVKADHFVGVLEPVDFCMNSESRQIGSQGFTELKGRYHRYGQPGVCPILIDAPVPVEVATHKVMHQVRRDLFGRWKMESRCLTRMTTKPAETVVKLLTNNAQLATGVDLFSKDLCIGLHAVRLIKTLRQSDEQCLVLCCQGDG
jgi:hypothetical protein